MAAIVSVVVIVSVSMLINRIATIALVLTGMSSDEARFQARAAMSGVGLTRRGPNDIVLSPRAPTGRLLADDHRQRGNRDGERTLARATRVPLPKGGELTLRTGGGGGLAPAAQRPPAAVLADVRGGHLTEAAARAAYPHAVS
jgi:N-methylhydantoinase B/oxoprolinase/acetone carboxylase alpha subunit